MESVKHVFSAFAGGLRALWAKVPQQLKPIVHTLWQAVIGALLAYLTAPHASPDVQKLAFGAWTTALAAAKAALLHYLELTVIE